MPNFNRSLVLTYSKVFGEKKELTNQSYSAIDKPTWAKILARLNFLARNEKHYDVIEVLKDWFGKESQPYANELLHRIIKVYQELNVHPSRIVTINVWTNLTILDNILKTTIDPEEKLGHGESEKELFNIYVATNDVYGEKSDRVFQTVSDELFPDTVDKLARVSLTLFLPYHDLNHFEATELFITGFVKTYYLFHFLDDGHQQLLDLFLKAYGVTSWKEYLKGILPLATPKFREQEDFGLNYLTVKDAEDKKQRKIFLDHLSLVDDVDYEVKTDFLHARANPLFKTEEDTYLILDSVLVVNRIYNSMFFELLRIAEKNKKLHPAYKEFFSFFTYEFIERNLCYSLLEKIFGKTNYYRISGSEIVKKYKIDTEPDFYVRNGNKVFLFEIKGSILTGNVKQSFDYRAVEKELKEKYLYHEGEDQKKAVAQLAERIMLLFQGNSIYDPKYNPKNIRVYPILLVSELAITTPGVNVVLNQWFHAEIEKNDILKGNKHRIGDLVVIDIDALILFSGQFENKKGLFEAALNGYYSAVDRKKIKPKFGVPATPEYMESLMMKSFMPFNGFVREFVKVSTPDTFLEFGEDLLKE